MRRTVPAEVPDGPQVHVGQLWLLSEEQLGRLLVLRSDLAEPAPASMAELEERSLSLSGVQRALMDADVLVLQLAQILTIIGQKHAALTDVRNLVGDLPEAELQQGLSWLEDRHLICRLPESEVCVHIGLLTIANAGGLGPPATSLVESLSATDLRFILKTLGRKCGTGRRADLADDVLSFVTDPDSVRSLVGGAPDEVREYAYRLARGSVSIQLPWGWASEPYRSGPGTDATSAPMWLMQRGLAYKDSMHTAVMPTEIGLALRGGRPFLAASFQRPQIAVQSVTPPDASAAEARVAKVIQAAERLVDAWGSKPAALLKNEGIGIREVRRLAGAVDMPERDTFRLIEMVAAAGLIVADVRRGLAMPTSAADEWLDLDAADRWWALALSWLETSMYPSLAGALDSSGKPLPALGYRSGFESKAAGQRLCVLRAVLELPSGSGADHGALAEVAVWNAPMLWSDVPGTPTGMVGWTLDEMELLGLVVDGAPTSLAPALIGGDLQAARNLLADPDARAWQMVLQADLTALVAGRAPSSVRAELELLADVEGRGSATLYRFSQASVRRAFDAGRHSAEILAFFEEHAAKGVPQPLAYLVGDVDRRHGQVRLGRAGCYIRFEDAALAAEVARNKRTSKLGLRQIAPTVLVCDQSNDAALDALRAAGYLPVVESEDGSVVYTPLLRHRAEAPLAPGHASAHPGSARGRGSSRPADRWRFQLSKDGTGTGSCSPGSRALAATLLRTVGESPPTPARCEGGLHSGPASMRGVELPTVLRRPTLGLEEPVELGDEAQLLADLLQELDGELEGDGMDLVRELLGMASQYPGGADRDEEPDRPTEIFRSRDEITRLLKQADEEEWLVRLSYTSAAGKSSEATVSLLGVSDSVVLAQVLPRWTDRKYLVDRIRWVRVLTDAEEELVW
ncbi:MAG: helicase-associated domain-containing protein [Acidimicrobiales bacterium]